MLPALPGTINRLRITQTINQEAGSITVTVHDGYQPFGTVTFRDGNSALIAVEVDLMTFAAQGLDDAVDILASHQPLNSQQQDTIRASLQEASTAHLLTVSLPVTDGWVNGYLAVAENNRPFYAKFVYSNDQQDTSASVEGEFGRVQRSITRLIVEAETLHPELARDRIFTSFATWFQQ